MNRDTAAFYDCMDFWDSGRGLVFGDAGSGGAAAPAGAAQGSRVGLTREGGRTWSRLDRAACWSVGFASPRTGWVMGPGGRVVHASLRAGEGR